MIRVLIAEDDELIRRALCLLVGSFHGITVTGEAKDGREAVAQAAALAPDVILMDLAMPVVDGVAATRRIKKEQPAARVIALTAQSRGPEIAEGLAAGLDGYLLKKVSPEELRAAIETTASGGRHICAEVSVSIAEALNALRTTGVETGRGVTPREVQILELLSQGCRAKEIAGRLGISARTVEKHRDSLRRKYGAETVAQLVAAYVGESRRRSQPPP